MGRDYPCEPDSYEVRVGLPATGHHRATQNVTGGYYTPPFVCLSTGSVWQTARRVYEAAGSLNRLPMLKMVCNCL